jgi:hypothetical protein
VEWQREGRGGGRAGGVGAGVGGWGEKKIFVHNPEKLSKFGVLTVKSHKGCRYVNHGCTGQQKGSC